MQRFARFECSACRGSRIVALDRVLPPRLPHQAVGADSAVGAGSGGGLDADLCSRVFAIFADEVARWQCSRTGAEGLAAAKAGSVLERIGPGSASSKAPVPAPDPRGTGKPVAPKRPAKMS